MLYVNEEPLKEGSAQWKRFQNFKNNALPGLSNPVVIKTSRPIKFNENGLPEAPKNEMIPLDYTLETENGTEHWRYARRPPRKKDGNLVFDRESSRKMFKGKWKIDKKTQPDLVFYMLEISPFLTNGKFYCENKRQDAMTYLDKETAELDVKYMILSEQSPISVSQSGSDDILRMAAAAWGIEDAHDTSILSTEEIKVKLLNTVKDSEKNYSRTQRGFGEFLRELNAKHRLAIRGNVQKALDSQRISYDEQSYTWRYTVNNQIIMTVPAKDASDSRRALNTFLSLNDKASIALAYALDQPYNVELPEDLSWDDKKPSAEQIESMKYHELKSLASKLEIKTSKMNTQTLKEAVLIELGYVTV